MSGINFATLIGHVGADPEIRQKRGGGKVATFSLATGEAWKDKATGERKERTEWHRIVVFQEALVAVVEKYVGKGIEALRPRRDHDLVGEPVEDLAVGVAPRLGPPPADDEGSYGKVSEARPAWSTPPDPAAAPPAAAPDLDDEIPF